jgi:hypothetical protein
MFDHRCGQQRAGSGSGPTTGDDGTGWRLSPARKALARRFGLLALRRRCVLQFTAQNTGGVAGTEVRGLCLISTRALFLIKGYMTRLRSCTCTSPSGRASRHPCCVGLRTSTCSRASRRQSVYHAIAVRPADVGCAEPVWMRAEGAYSFSIGASSRDFKLKGTLSL